MKKFNRKQVDDMMKEFVVKPGSKISLKKDFDPSFHIESLSKLEAAELLKTGVLQLAKEQDKLYAQNTYALLVVLQALDAAGKDGTIKHVMSGVNPQGCNITSFKAPSEEELDHDYLWRCACALPARGMIGIFNRSYYEEVLIARVHPEILGRQRLPGNISKGNLWKRRYEEINNFEKYLVNNGIVVLKIFLNVSKEEQKRRFLARIELPEKNWKFSISDAKERQYWKDYQQAYEDCFNQTSTDWAPWHIVPADNKPFTRLAVGYLIQKKLESLNLSYPQVDKTARQLLQKAKALLVSDSDK